MNELTHFDAHGGSRMVDVGAKETTVRVARASGLVAMNASTQTLIRDRKMVKGDVLEVARLAGIMGAKHASELIPLCHQLSLDGVHIEFDFPDPQHISIQATARASARTGVEMEALTAVSVAALTIYDMCKAVDRDIVIGQVQLEEKFGGESGYYKRER